MPFLHGKWIVFFAAAVLCALAYAPVFARHEGLRLNYDSIPLSAEEQAWLDRHKDLRLGTWLGSPPIIFRGDGSFLQGLVPTYIDLINRKFGLKPRRVRASGFAAMQELAKAHEVDVVAAITVDSMPGGEMLASEPYLFIPIVIATRSDSRLVSGLADLDGQVVAMEAARVPHLRIPRDYPAIVPLIVDSPAQGLQAVNSGQARAYVGAQPPIVYLLQRRGISDIRISAITEYYCSLAVGVRRDWPQLLTLVNRVLVSISEDERKNIHDYWTVLSDGRWMERPKVWRLVGGMAVGAGVLLLLILFWNRRLAREVSRREQVELELRQAYKATQQVLESADVIIVGLDYTGHVRLINSAGEAVTGYTREELIGKDWYDTVVPRDRYSFVWDEFNRIVRDGARSSAETFENPIQTKSGEIRHIQWRNSCVGPAHDALQVAVISFGTDITHRLQAEEELRLTQFVMDNAAMGVLQVRPSARIVYANRTASVLLGQPRSSVRRMTVPDVTPTLSGEDWQGFWERLKQKHVLTFEAEVKNGAGADIPVEMRFYYLLFKGTELAICFFADIGERKRVQRLREDVERMVRHDLRSPVLAVQTLLKFLDKADNLTGQQREMLEIAQRSSSRMLNIIDLSRTLFEMEEGTYSITPEVVDLLPLVSAVAAEQAPLMRARKVDMVVTIEGESVSSNAVFIVRSEEQPCYALLANLLKNAVEASPIGGTVTLNLETRDVHILSVHNAGIIPEAIRDVFFEKYVTQGKTRGTGLGTYTARLIATSLGGGIDFTTSGDSGTTLIVTLPLNPESDS